MKKILPSGKVPVEYRKLKPEFKVNQIHHTGYVIDTGGARGL